MKKLWLLFPCTISALIIFLLLFFLNNPEPAFALQGNFQTGGTDPIPPVATPSPGNEIQRAVEIDGLAPFPDPESTDDVNSLSWGDYNQDGNLDLAVGNQGGDNQIYYNDGLGNLTLAALPNCISPTENTQDVDWGDMDGDGDLDLAIGNLNGQSCVFSYNETTGIFSRSMLFNEAQETNAVAWAGWETSQFNAYLAVGNSDGTNAIYKFEGSSPSIYWQNVSTSYNTKDLAWGDFDNDGYPDLAVGNFGAPNIIYRNDVENSTMVPVFTTSGNDFTNAISWGDMNGDGYLDLAVGNGSNTFGTTHPDWVYCNLGPDGDFAFEVCWLPAEDPVMPTTDLAWGDYDSDGDLDLAVARQTNGETRIYINNGGALNPIASWYADDFDANGQAIAFADWNRDGDLDITIGYHDLGIKRMENNVGPFRSIKIHKTKIDTRSLAWGDYDGDGDLDLAVGNASATQDQLYETTPLGLTLVWSSPNLDNTRSVAWGDFDGDGDLDLAAGTSTAEKVYQNVGGNLLPYADFFDSTTGDDTYAVAWGDYDGDQDLDLAVGNLGSAHYIHINRNGVFTETITLPNNAQAYALAWGDFDQDHDLDLLVSNDGANRVYVNNGSGSLIPLDLPLSDENCTDDTRSIAWGDWDGDGDLDIAAGNAGGGSGCVQIIEASESGGVWSFTNLALSVAAYKDVRSVAWGDYDGDGDLDLIAGISGTPGGQSILYQNGNGSLEAVWFAPNLNDNTQSVSWADFDNDGDLDLAVGNSNPSLIDYQSRLYINTWNNSTDLPNDPTYVHIIRPDYVDSAWFFSSHTVSGSPFIPVTYELYDDEYDPAYRIEPQVSWDGGGSWEAAWEATPDIPWYYLTYLDVTEGVEDLTASPDGVSHVFMWNALEQLLYHQNVPYNPLSGSFAPFDLSDEEMDVVFRILVWSNPDHGGEIQRPAYGSATTQYRLDLRPDWDDSALTADREEVHPGETVDFTLQITQTDHGMPPAFILTEMPDELRVIHAPSTTHGYSYWSTEAITWTSHLDNWTDGLPLNEILTIDYTTAITRPLVNGTEVQNCANIFDGLHEPFDRCTTLVISSTPNLEESWKVVNDEPFNIAHPGDVLTYTITLTNTGTDNARRAVITDSLPAHLVWSEGLEASAGAASYSSGLLSWTGDVNVFEPVTITYTARVEDPLPGNTVITNTFWVNDQINPPFFTTPVSTTVLSPDLRPSLKTAEPARVEIGDTIHYTVILTNANEVVAEDVFIRDPLPAYTTLVPGSLTANSGSFGYISSSRTITWTGSVEEGFPMTLTFDVIVGPPANTTSTIINTAYVEDSVGGDFNLTATTDFWLPDFSGASKSADRSSVELYDVILYTIQLENDGGLAPEVSLVDRLPTGLNYVTGSLDWTGEGDALYDIGRRTISWDGTDLYNGDGGVLTFAATASCPADLAQPSLVNTASLDDSITFYNLEKQVNIAIPDLSSARLKSSMVSTPNGALLTYTVTIYNAGGKAPNAWMEDALPAGANWLNNYTVSTGDLTYNPTTRTVRWDGSLGYNESVTIRYTVDVSISQTGGNVSNSVTVGDDCQDYELAAVWNSVLKKLYLPLTVR